MLKRDISHGAESAAPDSAPVGRGRWRLSSRAGRARRQESEVLPYADWCSRRPEEVDSEVSESADATADQQ